VIAVHPSVKDLAVGDRVALEGSEPCHTCEECLHGKYNGCPQMPPKSTPPVPGFLRRYVKQKAQWCHKIGNMSYEFGALLEPLCVALAGLDRAGVACQGLRSGGQFCELHHFMNMYNYFLKVKLSLRTLSSLVINLFT
jgi:threonine dehydrogenase-like Zn-dependent dehydrogenase